MKTVFVQNIITPYRARLFNELASVSDNYVVYYMGETENDRNWDVSQIDIKHKHWIDRYGCYFSIKNFHVHLNPILSFKILFSRQIQNVILGVSIADINILFLALCKRLHLTNKRFFMWSEANYLTKGNSRYGFIKTCLRKFLYGAIDGAVIVPGRMSEITFEKWGVCVPRFIKLPNIIDDINLKYNDGKLRDSNVLPIFIMPVRLDESVKGVKNFFEAIGVGNIKRAVFYIAGDGPDRQIYDDYIKENNLSEHIVMMGFCDAYQMTELYNMVDAAILPSFSDPSPLSLVEFLYFHLPIICSDRCGNHYEVIDNGVNGYTFSPLSRDDIKATFERFMSERSRWSDMGDNSAHRYIQYFDTNNAVQSFVAEFDKCAK